jgi:antirestriction protein ArdC
MSSQEASPSRPNAELSAAYLCAEAGISPAVIDNEAAYLQGWLSKLKSEKRLIVIAAAKAQRAADYILGRSGAD